MNSNVLSHFLYTLVNLILALFFIIFGLMTFLLPWSETVKASLISFVQDNAWPWNLLGLGFILIGIGIGCYTLLTQRKRILVLKKGAGETVISENIVDDYLKTYLHQAFPSKEVPYRFAIHKNTLNIAIDFPFTPEGEQKKIMERTETDIERILRDLIGYRNSIEFSFSFEDK